MGTKSVPILPLEQMAKQRLYKLIFNQLKKLGYQDNDAVIVLSEPELNNWGVRGGIPANEIDLGFNLKV
ncbi:hypothetical protein [Desulfobacter vibrioformis]|uniref:hypothetical protein n=1 Tax=Desulfobacter vibrioformis TaxID=34031 RepID=UPI00068DADBA|nr:hypothetical protein [Desulfobacter vibrioformis]